MAEAYLRFYEELNEYLPTSKRKREFTFALEGKTSVRHMLEILAVPVSEVEFILVNGASADLSCFLAAGDRVSIYPVFESFNVKQLLRFRKAPLRRTKFVVDSGLRRLAFYLRLLGFDAYVDPEVGVAEEERRILLTANPAFSKSGLSRLYVIRERRPREQLKEIISRFDLRDSVHFSGLQRMVVRLLTHRSCAAECAGQNNNFADHP